jgi:hypothetical protein
LWQGSDAEAVNAAKGRPAEQPAGMAVADFTLVTAHIELDKDTVVFVQ